MVRLKLRQLLVEVTPLDGVATPPSQSALDESIREAVTHGCDAATAGSLQMRNYSREGLLCLVHTAIDT